MRMWLKFMAGMAILLWSDLVLSGCSDQQIAVIIYDGRTQTRLMTKSGQTVENLLEEAEISVDGEDVITPAREARITENQADIQIERCTNVVVETEDGESKVQLIGGRVEDALEEAGVTLLKNDYINHDMDAYCTEGMRFSVVHRMAVSLVADGHKQTCLTQVHTVKEFLEEQNVTLGALDRVSPKQSAGLSDGTEVVVKRVERREQTDTESIPFETSVSYSDSMTVGSSRVVREGENGEKKVTYQVTYVDGKEESRDVVREEVVKEAVNRQIVQGSKPKGRTVVSKQRVEDCDGSGHGFYIITYSDGTVEYEDF